MEQAREKPSIPPSKPTIHTQGEPSLSASSESSSERVPRFRSLQELYEVTENQDNLNLFSLFADCEPMDFQEAIQSKKWKDVMDEQIKGIEKNDTW